MANTTWPDDAAFIAWVPDGAELSLDPADIVELVADATDAILERIDTDKLPAGWDGADPGETCPRTIRRAILLETAKLYTRRDSANGAIAWGELMIRVGGDTDVEHLLRYWKLDAEP